VRRARASILGLVLLAAGCNSGSEHHAQDAPPAVPWTASTPPELVERTPVSAPCRGVDLRVPGQVEFVPRRAGGIALVQVRNVGDRPCRLTGRPRVEIVHDGGPRQVVAPIPTTPANFPETTYPESSLLALRPGEAADVTLTWDNWCDPVVQGRPHVPPSALRIVLSSGRGAVDADYNAVPPCVDPATPTIVGVSEFQPDLIRPGRPWSNAVLRASVPGQPLYARRGQLLRFRVVLTNPLATPVRFRSCPAYALQLVPGGTVEAHDLNCAAAHPIGAHRSEAFAMQLRVPADAPIGQNGLFWELDPFGAQAPQVHARVTVDG
jgi:uncharacterized protein DUF4232